MLYMKRITIIKIMLTIEHHAKSAISKQNEGAVGGVTIGQFLKLIEIGIS